VEDRRQHVHVFAEPRGPLAHQGEGVPKLQFYFGLNLQFRLANDGLRSVARSVATEHSCGPGRRKDAAISAIESAQPRLTRRGAALRSSERSLRLR